MSVELSISTKKNVPLIPLRDVVIYPHMVIPLFVGRAKSIKALEQAMLNDKDVVLVTQKSAAEEEPTIEDIYSVGTISSILQMLKLPDGTMKVLIEGRERAKIYAIHQHEEFLNVDIDEMIDGGSSSINDETQALMRSVIARFEMYVKLNNKIPSEIINSIANIEEAGRLADTIASHLLIKIEKKQELLEAFDINERLEHLLLFMETELDVLQVEKKIRNRVKNQMEKSQREYYLNEQIKAIRKELGDISGEQSDIDELKDRIDKAGMSKEAEKKARSELRKLEMMSPMSAEATVTRNYIDTLLNVPWRSASKLNKNLKNAERVLAEDHYGLDKVKERILEYLAVQQRVKKLKSPVLCFVGPPGVGKTSLGQSIARATGRHFIRIALGGVRDEAEIRGHRRTYIGALPGKIIQKIIKSEVKNSLILLDEIDKMAMDFRGDPASALLEVLDPEQNDKFNDHYLEVDYDLSQVMFICTANSLNIPAPLLDRTELIRLPGYTEDEKLHIASRHLIPKQLDQNGLKENEFHISDSALLNIIRYYTREAGVRGLERELAKIARKVVKNILTAKKTKLPTYVTHRALEKYLGVHRYRYGLAGQQDRIGQVTGLAWTEVGGELLQLEASVVPGKGKTTSTGSLGEVMQESIQAALTVVRSRAETFSIEKEFFETNDIHIHVPEGATPKDGPSAGIGMCTALVSAIAKTPVRCDVAMTGEITLRGEVLPIGGLKEKLLAAHRGGIKHVIIPEENRKDLKEIPKNIQQNIQIHAVTWIDQVFKIALKDPF